MSKPEKAHAVAPAQGLLPCPGPLGATDNLLPTHFTLPPLMPGSEFSTQLNFPLSLCTREKVGLGVPFSLMVGKEPEVTGAWEETGRVNFTKGEKKVPNQLFNFTNMHV